LCLGVWVGGGGVFVSFFSRRPLPPLVRTCCQAPCLRANNRCPFFAESPRSPHRFCPPPAAFLTRPGSFSFQMSGAFFLRVSSGAPCAGKFPFLHFPLSPCPGFCCLSLPPSFDRNQLIFEDDLFSFLIVYRSPSPFEHLYHAPFLPTPGNPILHLTLVLHPSCSGVFFHDFSCVLAKSVYVFQACD